ncbi:MAG: glycosyltransferase family 9 protein [Nitrospirae bacterium]|nr:glycosyltransferase family 9 protein [Nitrospirota bacterium]
MFLKLDCRYYRGEKPCKFNQLCQDCSCYEPMGSRILIIKLGATGDVLRTTCILKPIKERYQPCHITWVVDEGSAEVLKGNPFIDRLMIFNTEATVRLQAEQFDIVINFDKTEKAAAMAELVKGGEKYGFGLSKYGSIYPLNEECNYNLALGLSDELKFKKNKKTYQEINFESVCLNYKKEEYVFKVSEEGFLWAKEYLRSYGVTEKDTAIGINTGGSDLFAYKGWTEAGFHALAELCTKSLNAKVILLGGPREVEKNERIYNNSKVPLINTGNNNTVDKFAALIKCCALIVSGDTLAMHLAIAVKTPVVALFLSTCHQEIEFYGKGIAVSANVDCSPCYKKSCDKDDCIKDVSAERVYKVIVHLLNEIN